MLAKRGSYENENCQKCTIPCVSDQRPVLFLVHLWFKWEPTFLRCITSKNGYDSTGVCGYRKQNGVFLWLQAICQRTFMWWNALYALVSLGRLEMSLKHAKSVIVRTHDGVIELKDHGLLNLINRYHCDTNSKEFLIAWNQYSLQAYGHVLEIIEVDYDWSSE